MKKVILVLLLLVTVANQHACKSRKNIAKGKTSVDSSRIVITQNKTTDARIDSSFEKLVNLYTSHSSERDLSVDKITRITETSSPNNLKFTLNIDKIIANKDTLVAVDELTGTVAKIYKDANGVDKFDIKPIGSKKTTFELSGLKLKSKNQIDSSATVAEKANYQTTIKDSSASYIDSASLNKTHAEIKKDFKRTSPTLYWTSAIVLIIVIISVLAYIFRNKYPAAAWVSKKVFRR